MKRRIPFGRKTFIEKMEETWQVQVENSEEEAERTTQKGEDTCQITRIIDILMWERGYPSLAKGDRLKTC